MEYSNETNFNNSTNAPSQPPESTSLNLQEEFNASYPIFSNPSQIEYSPIESIAIDLTNDETSSINADQSESQGPIVEETSTALNRHASTSSDSVLQNKHWFYNKNRCYILEHPLSTKPMLFRNDVVVEKEAK